jgi:hypothetical protein
VRDNLSHLTNLHFIDRPWWQIYGEENSYSKQKHTQPANNNSDHEGDERHNTKVDERMYNREAKITDLVEEHLEIKEKTKKWGGG